MLKLDFKLSRMSIWALALSLILGVAVSLYPSPAKAAPDSRITTLVEQVQVFNATPVIDSYQEFLFGLFVNQGDARGYNEDGTPQNDLLAARAFIFNALAASLGSENVYYQNFTSRGFPGANVVGVLPGRGNAADYQLIISAHYDSVENPGADDDASGVAGMLEAARVLSKYIFNATIIFVAFDQEEERAYGWARGSRYYARIARSAGAKIRGMLVMDMIGYNDGGDDWMVITRPDKAVGSRSARLSKKVLRAFRDYTNLKAYRQTGDDGTDAFRFFRARYPAVTVIEDLDDDGWPLNPYYHEAEDFWLDQQGQPQQLDGRSYIDLDYAAQAVRGVVGWAAKEAGLL